MAQFIWLADLGAFVHPSLQLKYFQVNGHTLRGLGCIEPLPQGTVIARVPMTTCLQCRSSSAWSVTASGTGKSEVDAKFEMGNILLRALDTIPLPAGISRIQLQITRIALELLYHPGPQWTQYRQTLPQENEASNAFLFSEDALLALQSDKLASLIRRRQHWLHLVLSTLPWGQVGGPPSAALLATALFSVQSRLFNVHIPLTLSEAACALSADGSYNHWREDDVQMLAPLVDLNNHSFLPNTHRRFCHASKAFELITLTDVDVKSELTVGSEPSHTIAIHTSCADEPRTISQRCMDACARCAAGGLLGGAQGAAAQRPAAAELRLRAGRQPRLGAATGLQRRAQGGLHTSLGSSSSSSRGTGTGTGTGNSKRD
jgi:hypothetical protein